ncbi:alcohol dehydrogenase [Aspergillus brunneoviolaceus CBS 621.78]|uniref:Alcohol dehydrogenase n=1 Tax=Aspergillus brunneoviolaceus CBS 621.78 TaxID=1450534 RepID=A0ACD1GI62_9EURO|nr:alcohol dehydrogenase [Aspergillus brunneoviolaceus CBS 621.78]RAH48936.1 alcohol dehydrogenase [Aspergillus brunneoviolaceus CBS 621.78]
MAPVVPETCKAVVLDGTHAPWSLRDVPVKLPAEGEILIKSLACGVCHSDVATQNGEFDFITKYPIIAGHEVIGEVVALGLNVKDWKIGDRAGGAWHGGNDGHCKACARGTPQICSNLEVNGVTRDGGFSEYCTLRADAAIRVPTDMDPVKTAPLLCAGITAFNGIRKFHIPQGDTVAICGIGGLGHLAIQFARKMGYRTVAVSGTKDKRDAALALGAHQFVHTGSEDPVQALKQDGEGASLVMMFCNDPEMVKKMTAALAPGGSILLIAPVNGVTLDFTELIVVGKNVRTWSSGFAPETREALDFASHLGVECQTQEFALRDIDKAFNAMNNRTIRFRPVINFAL